MIIENNDKISLNTLLKNYIVYIPDMQRDYCWGVTTINNTDITLFENFINTLEQNINENRKEFTMGLFYGYTESKRLYLCDGQQRITSLYLILLYGYKLGFVNGDILNRNNITTLQYAVRDSSLFFLNDLFVHINNINTIESIKDTDWYINEYNNDDTIINIMASLKILETYYENNKEALNRLVSYILNEINFIFIDINTRENGEETYVLLNTTGEPLTRIENLKPYLVYDDDTTTMENNTVEWEKIEQFFWEQSIRISENQSNLDRNTIAETLMNNFLDIITTAEYQNIEIDSIKVKDKNKNTIVSANKLTSLSLGKYSEYYKDKTNLEIIIEYFSNFLSYYVLLDHNYKKYIINKIYKIDNNNFIREYYSIISIIYFAKKFINHDSSNEGYIKNQAIHFFEFFYNIFERNMEGGIENITIYDVIKSIKQLDNPDIISLLYLQDSFIFKDHEEYLKLKMLADNIEYRDELKRLFHSAYKLKNFKHRILLIIEASLYHFYKDEKEYKNIDKISNIIQSEIKNFIAIFNAYIDKLTELEKLQSNELIINMIKYNAPKYPVTGELGNIAGGLWYSPNICIFSNDDMYKWLYHNKITNINKIIFLNNFFQQDDSYAQTPWKYLVKYSGILKYSNKNKRFGYANNNFYARRYINTEYEIKTSTILLFDEFLSDTNKVNKYLGEINDYREKTGNMLRTEYKYNSNIFIYDKNIDNKGDIYNRYGGIICIEKNIHDKTFVIDVYVYTENKFIIQIFFRNHEITQQYIENINNNGAIIFQVIEENIYKQKRYQAIKDNSSYQEIVKICDSILETII